MLQRPLLRLLEQAGVKQDGVHRPVHGRHLVVHPLGHVGAGLGHLRGQCGWALQVERGGFQQRALHAVGLELGHRTGKAGQLLQGVAHVGEHGRHAGAPAHQAGQPAQPAGVTFRRVFHALPRGRVQPRQQQVGQRGRVDGVQRRAHRLVAHQARDVAHRGLEVREAQHLVDVLRQQPQVERQRPVVLDACLREALGRAWEAVRHALALGGLRLAHPGIGGLARVGLRRDVATAVASPRGFEGVGRHLVEVAAEHVAVGSLRTRLGALQQIPHALREVVVRLGQHTLGVHARDERIPAAGVEHAIVGQLGPSAPQQQLALVALVAGVQNGVQQLGARQLVGPEAVAQLGRLDAALALQVRLHLAQQLLVGLQVDGLVGAVALGGLLDGAEHEASHRPAKGAVEPLGPLLDPAQARQGSAQQQPALVARRDRLVLAQFLGHPALVQAARHLGNGVFHVQRAAVHLQLATALGQVPQGLNLLVQAAQLLDAQRLKRLGQGQRTAHAGLQRVVHAGVVLAHLVQVVERILLALLPHPVGGQHGTGGHHHIRVSALLDGALGPALGHLAEELQHGLALVQRFQGGAGRFVVQQLVALGLHRFFGLALRGGLLPAPGSTPRRRLVLAGLGAQIAQRRGGHHLLPELPCGFGQRVDRDARALGIGAAGVGALVQQLALTAQFAGQYPGARLVVHRLQGRALDGALVGQVGVVLQHALVGQRFDRLARAGGLGKRLDQIHPAGETEQIRHQVDVDAAGLGRHAQLLDALALLGRQLGGLQRRPFNAPCRQRLQVQSLAGLDLVREVLVHAVLGLPAQLGVDGLLEVAQLEAPVVLGQQVAQLRQALAHGVGAQAAGLAKGGLAEHAAGVLEVVRMNAQQVGRALARQAPELGHRHQQRVERWVQLRARLGGRVDAVSRLHPAGQELPGAVQRLRHDLAPGLDALLAAQCVGFALQLADRLVRGAARPLQVADRARGQALLRFGRRLQIGQQTGHLLRLGDLVLRGQQPIEHPAHVVVQLGVGVPARELLQRAVHAQHPGAEAAHQRLQLLAGGLALHQVLLDALGEALVHRALLVQRQRAPGFHGLHAEPLQHRRHVHHHVGRRVGLARHVGQHFQEEVPGLVEERRQVGRR